MAEPAVKQILKKPPGYRDPNSLSSDQTRLPVRKPVLPPSYYYDKETKRRKRCRMCCCCFFTLLIAFLIFLGVAGGVIYLWFMPKLPVFRVRSVELDQFNISSKEDATYLDSETTTRLEVKNPNEKMTIYYGQTTVTLTADGETDLGSASLPGFAQGRKNVTVLKFTTRAENQVIDDSGGKMLGARVKSQAVRIDVEAKTKVGVGVGSLKIGMLGLNVLCGAVSLKQLNNGDPPKCTINTLLWINIH
ncbi:hypothetical protein Nepgr_002284 [Nepenthes gracilis]|uniref:Late embryogenesis abundant protein LEA-2 subgroup domain-containing protein n=1 Tax=Nepenthes gracilis TaxID=150966 RepID=A0AAD3P7M5_NEPGR|nr:hypothetical protein Nepgr_002284 [Nepenthes gracilis]